MDAHNKAEKLAAAKKKLKQFQQKSGSKSTNNASNHERQDNNQSSTGSSLTAVNAEPPVDIFFSAAALDNGVTSTQHNSNVVYSQQGTLERDADLTQMVQILTKEKMELMNSFRQTQELAQQLQHQLNEEREKSSTLAQQQALYSSSQNNHSQENELKNTLSILIEEKNELAAAHSHCQSALQKTEEELEELKLDYNTLQAKFALSEQCRVDDVSRLEASNQMLNEELASMREELRAKNQAYSDLSEEFKELQTRQNHQTAELNLREVAAKELASQIELLNLNMEQLKNAGPPTVDQSLEKMQKENSRLEAEVGDLREQYNKLNTEKDLLAQQYQQYILRLNGQIRTLNSQMEAVTLEKRNVEATLETKNERITELEATVSDLQTKAQTLPTSDVVQKTSEPDDKIQPPVPLSDPTNLTSAVELDSLRKQLNEMASDNDQLAKLALEKESRIQELEIRVDRLQSELNIAMANQDTVHSEKLLQTMQNDKVAASRAIAQNRQLKIQLEELEKAFIQLSNDKLALTDQAQVAAKQNKDYSERLEQLEPELAQLRHEVTELAGQRDATIYWKQELEEAHERIQALSHQNAELKKRVIWNLGQEPARNGKHKHHHHHHHNPDQATPGEDNHSSSSDNEEDPDWVPREELEKMRFHHGQLEQKLQKAMGNVANLTEEKQKLEHLVLQLQSETETIGEYVSLYQVQRGLLRRRAEQLATERQRLKERIDKLTQLLPRLAPQLEKLPQWVQLRSADHEVPSSDAATDPIEALEANQNDVPIDQIASSVLSVLTEITSSHIAVTDSHQPLDPSDPFLLIDTDRAPHENFHPCQVCSGRLMTV